jgi:hypothetical protein
LSVKPKQKNAGQKNTTTTSDSSDISGGGIMRDKRNSRLMGALAIGMIGAGIMGAICPKRHIRLWRFRLNAFRDFIDALADRPGTVRLIHVAEAGLGVWLALRNLR